MKLKQRNTLPTLRNTKYLRVDAEKAVELIDVTDNESKFRFRFGVYVSSFSDELKDYDRVRITIKKKEGLNDTPSEKFLSALSEKKSLQVQDDRLPAALQDKLYSGINLIRKLSIKENFIKQEIVYVQSGIKSAQSRLFQCFDLEETDLSQTPSSDVTKASALNEKDLLSRINQEKLDPSSIFSNRFTRQLTSNYFLENSPQSFSYIPKILYDLSKFCLSVVPPSPEDTSGDLKAYKLVRKIKSLDEMNFIGDILIPRQFINEVIVVRFDLLTKKDVVVESKTIEFNSKQHFDAYKNILTPPDVSFSSFDENYCELSIVNKNNRRRVSGVNIYAKSIDRFGSVENYKLIDTVRTFDEIIRYRVKIIKERLWILRVVPLDIDGKESGTFTNVVIGRGHDAIGSLTLNAMCTKIGSNVIEIYNIPKNCNFIDVYRRDCTENPYSKFELLESFQPFTTATSTSRLDNQAIKNDHVYEYYAIAYSNDVDSQTVTNDKKSALISNYSLVRNRHVDLQTIVVNIDSVVSDVDNIGQPTLSFVIRTDVTQQENESITESLKSQLGELYDQYLNPVANASSPLGSNKGLPNYADLYVHEVSRINLNTGEKETFPYVTDGIFSDNSNSQSLSNISPINPQHTYIYQVFTFRKNPIELFKNFVAKGITKNQEWFYLPYKWRSPKVLYGRLYPDDDEGIPIIELSDSFTSNSYGLTASYKLDGSTIFSSVNSVDANRIDINTVKITWKLSEQSKKNFQTYSTDKIDALHDCFIVMKNVNGVRKFVGVTKNQYLYHDLALEDAGTIYYTVLPVMTEFDIDEPAYSNSLVIEASDLFYPILTNNLRIDSLNQFSNTVTKMAMSKVTKFQKK